MERMNRKQLRHKNTKSTHAAFFLFFKAKESSTTFQGHHWGNSIPLPLSLSLSLSLSIYLSLSFSLSRCLPFSNTPLPLFLTLSVSLSSLWLSMNLEGQQPINELFTSDGFFPIFLSSFLDSPRDQRRWLVELKQSKMHLLLFAPKSSIWDIQLGFSRQFKYLRNWKTRNTGLKQCKFLSIKSLLHKWI